ncbi:hypothetical protein [Streptomyces atratus]|uniref:Uncharacterized protein n=1 Tax=Streptomyces atratus TaxID=1893 RepID=A0A2Z5JPF4_STRAR|nr:hypothetical protein [Streptomyces atratus]AXE82252.1 hypothetical protein C5746_41450 [Streptomyces atratus]
MGKKSRNPSARSKKLDRQERQRAARHGEMTTVGMAAVLPLDAFPVLHEGEIRILPADRIRARFEAELASDNEPPLDGDAEFRSMLVEDVQEGRFRLRRDGNWESDNDYFAAPST